MSAAPTAPVRATLHDLMGFEGKAELVNGRVEPHTATGHRPNIVAGRIYRRLADHAEDVGRGFAYTDNMGFAVPELASGRESFSPDASYYSGPPPAVEMRFVEAPPDFAVEVRSENDYGPAKDRAYASKRADYFEAGTLVVWDVDPVAGTAACYRAADPLTPQVFGPGEWADAEPAVPGWRVAVDALMA